MPKLLIALVIASQIGWIPSAVFAATADSATRKFYDVEVIVFKNINVPKSHEFNLPTPAASRAPNTLDLSDPRSVDKARDSGFMPLPIDELRLTDTVQSIVKSSRYGLLAHTGWRQPGLEEKQSIPVWIKGGQTFDSSYSSIDQITDQPGANRSGSQALRSQHSSGLLYELEGQITITLSRYLHTRAELVLRKPANPSSLLTATATTPDQPNPELFPVRGQLLLNHSLNEQRRMRSRKLHYLDHPEFGMLVLITPYEPPQPGVDEAASSTTDTGSEGTANANGTQTPAR